MVCKIYQYEDKKSGSFVYLNADDSSKINPQIVLKEYINWYNKDFAPFENKPLIKESDFVFISSFCPIDFYNETSKIARSLYA